MSTLKQALRDAETAGYLYVTDQGTNADGELWCISECDTRWDLDADSPKSYELEGSSITEYDHNGNPTGWYLECSDD